MSRSYKNRRKAVRDEKRRLGVKMTPPARFEAMQSGWREALRGPFLGTLEGLMLASREGEGS